MRNIVLPVFLGIFILSTPIQAHYLSSADLVDGVTLLPPPPAKGTNNFKRDIEAYKHGKTIRDTDRGKIAISDIDKTPENFAKIFSEPMNINISEKKTPEIFKLISNIVDDAKLAARDTKNHYMRIRPLVYYNEPTCLPSEDKYLAKTGSYPSAHSTRGWLIALVLSEIDPKDQTPILKRGYEYGQSRVICGAHWQSDVDAGRDIASATVATLHTNKNFIKQLEKAKAEFKKVK